MPPATQALSALDSYESRLSRLEDEARETSTKVTEHTVGLQHLGDRVEEKIQDMKTEIGQVRTDIKDQLKDFKETVGGQISALSAHVTKATDQISDNNSRLKQIEEAREKSRAFRKWLIVSLGGISVSGATYLAQQLLSRVLHH